MKLYLIRHGETDWNLQGRFQGREDIALNKNGLLQAEQCGNALRGEKFQAVITSPLVRAKKTAEIIAACVSVNNVITEEGIIERDFSKVSGLTPSEREAFYASGQKDDKEPWDALCNRMLLNIKKYAEKFPDGNIIMISHGASINAILSVLSGGKTGTGKILLKNTCINIINYDQGDMELEIFNLTAKEYMEVKKSIDLFHSK